MTDLYAGGPAEAGSALSHRGAQKWTIANGRTFTAVRVQAGTTGDTIRVGFCASKPTNPSSPTWLAYADIVNPPASGYSASTTLNTPLTVAPGDVIWAVAINNDAGGFTNVNVSSGNPPVDGVSLGEAGDSQVWYSENGTTWTALSGAYPLSVQAVVVDGPSTHSATSSLTVTTTRTAAAGVNPLAASASLAVTTTRTAAATVPGAVDAAATLTVTTSRTAAAFTDADPDTSITGAGDVYVTAAGIVAYDPPLVEPEDAEYDPDTVAPPNRLRRVPDYVIHVTRESV